MLFIQRAIALLVLSVTWATTFQHHFRNIVAAIPQPCQTDIVTCGYEPALAVNPHVGSPTEQTDGYGRVTLQRSSYGSIAEINPHFFWPYIYTGGYGQSTMQQSTYGSTSVVNPQAGSSNLYMGGYGQKNLQQSSYGSTSVTNPQAGSPNLYKGGYGQRQSSYGGITVMNPQPGSPTVHTGGYGQMTIQQNTYGGHAVMNVQPAPQAHGYQQAQWQYNPYSGLASQNTVGNGGIGMQTRFVNGMPVDFGYINRANGIISTGLPHGTAGQPVYVDNLGNIFQVADGKISEEDRRPDLSKENDDSKYLPDLPNTAV